MSEESNEESAVAPFQPEEEEEGSDEESSSSYDDDDVSSSFDSELEEEGRKLIEALQQENETLRKAAIRAAVTVPAQAPQPPQKTPLENWNEFVESVERCSNATIKVTDEMVAWVTTTTKEDSDERTKLCEKLCQDLVRASLKGFVVIHSILGRNFLSLLSAAQQELVFQAIVTKHAKTITYWKLGSDDSTEACGIPTTALLRVMATAKSHKPDVNGNPILGWPNLTELEIRGLEIDTQEQIDLLLEFLKVAPKIREFNLLGMVIHNPTLLSTPGLLDPIVTHVQTIPGFDELQLCRTTAAADAASSSDTDSKMPSLISTAALQDLFSNKVKWWRFGLDGMGLTDQHIGILGTALETSDACKMNDLLSLQNNPKVSTEGWNSLYNVCLYKQRMGLVLSDDKQWVSTFDLIRPLNNLHRRLEYIQPVAAVNDDEAKDDQQAESSSKKKKKKYKYRSKEAWVEFLSVVGNLAWVGDARQVNYLWFAMLEQPELINE